MSALDRAIDSYRGTLVEYGYSDTSAKEAAQELLDLRANLDAAVRFLKLLDIRENKSLFVDECPFCGWEMGHGHDCDLAAFLKRMEAE